LQLLFTIGGALLPLLLMLDNQMTNLPIALHHGGIDGLPSLPDNVGNILKEQACIICRVCFDICLISQIDSLAAIYRTDFMRFDGRSKSKPIAMVYHLQQRDFFERVGVIAIACCS